MQNNIFSWVAMSQKPKILQICSLKYDLLLRKSSLLTVVSEAWFFFFFFLKESIPSEVITFLPENKT